MSRRNKVGALSLAVTGGIACGKSELGKWLSQQGFDVVDADNLAHESMTPGGEAYAAVVQYFGRDMLTGAGLIDRRKLGAHVFRHPEALAVLNGLIHPGVLRACRQWQTKARTAGRPFAALVPLLFEVGETSGWDAIICVCASEEHVLARLLDRGLSLEEARLRCQAQWPVEKKAAKADFVLHNDGDINDLHKNAELLLERITKKEP